MSRYSDEFLRDLDIAVNECLETALVDLWYECEVDEEPLAEKLGPEFISVLNSVAQASCRKAVDVMLKALRQTLQEDDD